MGHKSERLQSVILEHSASVSWRDARAEWEYQDSYLEQGGTCVCSHHPITEHCQIYNSITGHHLVVGNVCVRQFMGIVEGGRVLAGLKRVRKDPTKSFHPLTIQKAYERGWIPKKAWVWYLANIRRGKLLAHEATAKVKVNKRILLRLDEESRARLEAQQDEVWDLIDEITGY